MRIMKLAIISLSVCFLVLEASAFQAGKQVITRDTSSNAPFSPAVAAGDFIYLSGTLARGEGIREQTRGVLSNLGEVLELAGADYTRVAAVTVYLRNTSDFQGMNEIFREYFPSEPPTRTTVQTDLVREDALVEMSMIAIRPGAERTVLQPEGWPTGTAPYSYGIKSGDTVFLAGILGRDYSSANSSVGSDIQAETRAIFENARQILAAAGMSLNDVVASRVYITDNTLFRDMNTSYSAHFPEIPPARATVRANLMGDQYHLEITLIAVAGAKTRITRPNADGTPGRESPVLSHAVRVGNRLYLSGMLGVSDETRTDTQAQARQTLATIGRTLDAAGFGIDDLVDGVVYLTDMSEWGEMNVAYREAITGNFPARAAVGTGLMSGDGRVEIMFTAVR
ncbi:MAG: RidA family protein [Acidobacteriota bacterium]|nr:RidA family protein [Acidobacteriota bacterium]